MRQPTDRGARAFPEAVRRVLTGRSRDAVARIAEKAVEMLHATLAVVVLVEGRNLGIVARSDAGAGSVPSAPEPSQSLAALIIESGTPCAATDLDATPLPQTCRTFLPTARSVAGVPLKVGGRVIGAFLVESPAPRAFGQAEQESLDFLAGLVVAMVQDGRPASRGAGRSAAHGRADSPEWWAARQARWLDAMQEAILVGDADQKVCYGNRAVERTFGWTLEEVLGRSLAELLLGTSEIPAAIRQPLEQTGEWNGELNPPNKSGRELTIRSRWTLLRDSAGSAGTIFVINYDVTDQKKLEAQLLRAQRLESIGTLASGIAHDLNNILTPILMAAPLLRSGLPADRADSFLSLVETNAQRGADIVKQLLAFGRGVQPERITLQLRHLLNDMLRMVKATFPRSIRVETRLPADLWPIAGDPTQIQQVFLNLCVNARDAMPQGGTLSVAAANAWVDERQASVNPGSQPGPYVVLTVKDNGVGMEPEVVDRIFDPFFTTKAPGQGTGLGLATVLGILKGHGGFVTVDSAPGRGTQFEVFFPAVPGREAAATEPGGFGGNEGEGQLILVVDDEPAVREVTQASLEAHGYRVVTAGDGADALAAFVKHRGNVCAVMIDVMMPVMDGYLLARTLRKLDPAVRLIACTGDTSSAQQRHKLEGLRELGVCALLPKPFATRDLLKALHDALSFIPPESGGAL